MANLRNEFEFRSALLTALGQEHTEAEAKNEEMWRRKMLDGLGVEYDQNDVNQFGLFREKLIEGVTSKSEGGGGSWQTVFEGNVTTHDDDGEIFVTIENLTLNGNSIRVTFNGTVYELPKTEHGYGAETKSGIDFSTYPLFIATGGGLDSCTLWTLTAGTYSLKIEEPQSGSGSSDFSTAEVTIKAGNNAIMGFLGYLPFLESDGLRTVIELSLQAQEQTTKTIVLYKGKTIVSGFGFYAVDSTSGNITLGADDFYVITGDCSITLIPQD